jgi:methylglutamate dehydrogenase subunit A
MTLPSGARVVVIGAGIHGLSTAWHLARSLSEADVVVLDKSDVGAGASGIACGVIRNNYYQPAMRELMAHSVSVWESDKEAFSYHPIGYLQIAPEGMHADVAEIYEQQRAIGYESVLVEGADDCRTYMQDIFSDWQATGSTVVLHEKRGGYANNMASLRGLRAKAEAAGVRIIPGVQVTGLDVDGGGAVTSVSTTEGKIRCDQLVVAVGPWIRDMWALLDLPAAVDVLGRDGNVHRRPMWTYWDLQEGTLGVDPSYLLDNHGRLPPVVHVDSDQPLIDDNDGTVVTEEPWGIYYKPDFDFDGVQGGGVPSVVDRPAEQVAVDPYGPASPEFVVDRAFVRLWTSALAHCQKRFEGQGHLYRWLPTGGIGAFTPDSFPVFDVFRDNAYVIADSNHGYKMLGVGALVAKELLGEPQALLEPFRFARYREGKLHPVSHSPFPWS